MRIGPSGYLAVSAALLAAGGHAMGNRPGSVQDPEDARAPAALAAAMPAEQELPRLESERAVRRWIRSWPNMRIGKPFEIWSWDPDAKPTLREAMSCLRDLRRANVRFTRDDPSPLVPFAVKVARVPGLTLRGREFVASCELAARLPAMAALLREHGIGGMTVMSAWRSFPGESFHTLGLAIDIMRFTTVDGVHLDVEDDFVKSESAETCAELAPDGKPRQLQAIACSLFAHRLFSTVLTPNYNRGHRDHFHVDIRPGDERFYLR